MNTQTTRRKLTTEFKTKMVIEALREQSTLEDIAKKYEITQAQLSRWKKEFLANVLVIENKFDNFDNFLYSLMQRYLGFRKEKIKTDMSVFWK